MDMLAYTWALHPIITCGAPAQLFTSYLGSQSVEPKGP